jgi:hypothetical protein
MRFEGSINARKIEFNEEGDRSVSYEKSEDIPREIIARSSQEPYKYLCRWVGSQLTFPGHAETTIHVSYEAQYIGFEHEGEIFFIFGTGFGWKGAIGNAVVILDASEIDRKRRFSTLSTHMSVIGEKSAGWVRTPRSISDRVMQHEFRNFKPKPGAYFKVKLSKP